MEEQGNSGQPVIMDLLAGGDWKDGWRGRHVLRSRHIEGEITKRHRESFISDAVCT